MEHYCTTYTHIGSSTCTVCQWVSARERPPSENEAKGTAGKNSARLVSAAWLYLAGLVYIDLDDTHCICECVCVCTIPLTTLCSCETHYWHNQLLLPRCLSGSIGAGPLCDGHRSKKRAHCVVRDYYSLESPSTYGSTLSPAHSIALFPSHMRPQKRLFIIGRRPNTNQKGIKRRPDAFNALNWGCERGKRSCSSESTKMHSNIASNERARVIGSVKMNFSVILNSARSARRTLQNAFIKNMRQVYTSSSPIRASNHCDAGFHICTFHSHPTYSGLKKFMRRGV